MMSSPHMMQLFLVLLVPLATVHISSIVAASARTHSSLRHKRNAEFKTDLDAMKDNLASIQDGISNFQKRSCALGLNSHHCAIAHLDDVMMGSDYLRGGFSPGKRSTQLPDDIRSRAELILQNLSEQMEAVNTLRHILSQLGNEEKQEEKRTCRFRLGNHCLTEALDRAAASTITCNPPSLLGAEGGRWQARSHRTTPSLP